MPREPAQPEQAPVRTTQDIAEAMVANHPEMNTPEHVAGIKTLLDTQAAQRAKDNSRPASEFPDAVYHDVTGESAPGAESPDVLSQHGQDIQPIGHGSFGPIYDQFKGDDHGAVQHLMRVKAGEAVAALHHPEIGDIDLPWGKTDQVKPNGRTPKGGNGLSHIIYDRPDGTEIANNLQRDLNDMKLVSRNAYRAVLESDGHCSIVSLTHGRDQKTWLLSEFSRNDKPAAERSIGVPGNPAEGRTAEHPSTAGSNSNIPEPAENDTLFQSAKGKAKLPPTYYSPDDIVLTERDQDMHKVADIAKRYKNHGEPAPSIITKSDGENQVMDGHHRALALEQLGRNVPTIGIRKDVFDSLKEQGHDPIDILAAVYKSAGYGREVSYLQFKGDDHGAVQHLMRVQTGEALAALHHTDVGDIDLPWGDADGTNGKGGHGLAHIIYDHPDVDPYKLQEMIDGMEVVKKSPNRIILQPPDATSVGVIALERRGTAKNWLLTAYNKPAAEGSSGVPDNPAEGRTVEHPSTAGSNSNIPEPTKNDTLFQHGHNPQLDTPEFKQWFGDSDSVNKDGSPQVMYHGTRDFKGHTFDQNKHGGLFSFTDSPDVAERYAEGNGGYRSYTGTLVKVYSPNGGGAEIYSPVSDGSHLGVNYVGEVSGKILTPSDVNAMVESGTAETTKTGASVMPVYIKTHALDLTSAEGRSVLGKLDAQHNTIASRIINNAKSGYFNWSETQHEPAWKTFQKVINPQLKQLGYDAIKYNDCGHTTTAVFDPKQIKSAIGNRGTFDPNDANILHQSAKGSVTFRPEDGKAVVRMLQSADISTAVHEIAHVWRRTLSDEMRAVRDSLWHQGSMRPAPTLLVDQLAQRDCSGGSARCDHPADPPDGA